MKTRLPILLTVLFTLIPALLFLPACDEDDSPTKQNDPPVDSLAATSVLKLLEEVFEDAYSSQDSAAYAATLDSLYEFEMLPDSVDAQTVETWDLTEELRIAKRMFSGWTSADGIKVLGIDLEMAFQGKTPTTEDFQDQPEGEIWYKAITEIDLKVITQDPTAYDGSGIINRVIFSNQDFIVKPDPDDADLWVIRRQIDRESITKRGGVPDAITENSNWGAVKGMFR